jgi:hypothetical protein
VSEQYVIDVLNKLDLNKALGPDIILIKGEILIYDLTAMMEFQIEVIQLLGNILH